MSFEEGMTAEWMFAKAWSSDAIVRFGVSSGVLKDWA